MNQFPEAGQVIVEDGFLKHYMEIVAHCALPYQWQMLNGELGENPTMRNFRIATGDEQGAFGGVPYQDTDLAKWLDAVGCALGNERNPELEALADAAIDTIVRAQDADGYLDTYYQLVCPDRKWTDPESHELYCFGHMIEAGVSYSEGTGKRALLEAACRLADHVGRVFGPAEGKLHGYRGHEIIEMALVRLAAHTGEACYLRLAEWFVHARHDTPEAFYRGERKEGNPLDYGSWGWGDPERETSSYEHVTGHAVRAMYLYSGMADVARLMGDEKLLAHCTALFTGLTRRQMYITGGIGATSVLEAFTYPYDLPNDTLYAETCASVGLCFFAQRMALAERDSCYADAVERCIFNLLPAAVAQDGEHYFYVNPLQVNAEACLKSPLKTHVKPERQPWFDCACCPPNLARFFASLPRYLYAYSAKGVTVHQYAPSAARFQMDGGSMTVRQSTGYPFDGVVQIAVEQEVSFRQELALRIPDWCESWALCDVWGDPMNVRPEKGYLNVEIYGSCAFTLTLDMTPRLMQANRRVREDAGLAALQRGPVVYCVEQADNGELLENLSVKARSPIRIEMRNDVKGFGPYPAMRLRGETDATEPRTELYFPCAQRRDTEITAVPYCLWGERTVGEMLVWLRRT
ncbi:MAG: glycoside hydrolase family 127 protein [Eubacteriales bacterium]|nr:glycoside hydrolase family 127 protein [Eubacteriales bacterium]